MHIVCETKVHTYTHTYIIIEWKMVDNYITKIKGFWIIHWVLNAKTLRYDENWEVIPSNIPCEQQSVLFDLNLYLSIINKTK